METNTNTPNYDTEPKRASRTNWFLIAVIILLGIVSLLQGFILFGIKYERDGFAMGKVLRERFQKAGPGKARQAAVNPRDNQVIFWETADDLDQIHDQINRLLRNMALTFGSPVADGPFPGGAVQRANGNRPAALPPAHRDLSQLQQEIERIFEEACNASQPDNLLARVNHGWDGVPSAAAMNIEDQGSNYVVAVALPGYDKQGITINLEGRLLMIDAANPSRPRAAPAAHRDSFHTQIMMPDNIEGAGAQAVFDHDVLRVQIPKAAATNSLVRPIAIR